MVKVKDIPTLHVMLIDANNSTRNTVSMLLKMKNFKVDTSSTAFQAFALMEKTPFQVLIITESIEDMSVYEVHLLCQNETDISSIIILRNSEENDDNKQFASFTGCTVIPRTGNYLELMNHLNKVRDEYLKMTLPPE